MKTSLFRIYFLTIALALFYGCEIELTKYELISFERCEEDNVTINPFIITDFECQSNIEISDVSVVRNPSETGINTSKFVGEYIDGSSATDALTIYFTNGVDLSTNASFKFKAKTAITGTLRIQLIGGSDGTLNFDIVVEGNQTWTEYDLDLTDLSEDNFTQFNLIFNNGVENSGNDAYFLDDLRFDVAIDPCEGAETDLSIINDFDCQQNFFMGGDPSQTSAPIIENPSISGINPSENVGEYTDNGTEPFDNLLIDLGEAIDLSENAQFNIKIRSNIAGPVLAKLEGGTMAIERTANIQETNEWVELTFDFTAAQDAGNTRLILFFNAGNSNGTETDTYFIDDLRFVQFVEVCEGVTPDLTIVSDFECQQNYALGNAVIPVENPNSSEANMSSTVGRYTDNGTDPFDSLIIDFVDPLDLSENAELNIKVLTTMQMPLLAMLEGGDTTTEVTIDIDVVNEWSNYLIDFSGAIGDGNTRLVLFFNAGQTDGTAQDIYFIDDIRFIKGGCPQIVEDCDGVEPDLSIINDFDCQQNFPFANAGDLPTVQNPDVTCENRSSKVGEYTDNGGDPFDNTIINFGDIIDLSINNQFKMKVLATETGPILAKLEGGTALEVFADVTVLNEWVEYTFDFSGAIGDKNTSLVLFFNAGEVDGPPQNIYYIDDLRFE